MKISCSQSQLAKALNTVSKAISSKTTIPILKGFLLNAKEGILTISASDMDISIEKKIEVNVEEEGTLVLSAKLFADIIRKLPNEEVYIEESENFTVTIRCLSSEFTLVGFPPDEFPIIADTEHEDIISLDKEVFKEMIKKTAFAASIEESKGIIIGVLIEMEENQLSLVALDGFRMAVAKETVKNEKVEKIIILARILGEVNKIIMENEDENSINLILSEKKAIFLMDKTKIVLRLLDGDFIKYRDVIPSENQCKVKVNRNEILSSLERASLLAKEGKNNLIKLSITNDKILITSRSEEGNVKEEVFIEKEGNDLDIGFNSKYLLDMLKAISDEEIMMEFNTSVSPCIIKPLEGDAYLYLILPVRIASN